MCALLHVCVLGVCGPTYVLDASRLVQVEACYPFMEQDTWVAASAYVASMWSTVLLARADGRSSAYLPLPLSIWLSDGAIARPALVAFGLPFLVAALRNATAEWRI